MTDNRKPNFILILCDNLGFGDIGCFGSEVHNTPNLDNMAEEGIRLTSFYVSSPVCTPSRASFMTGCYAQRVDMHLDEKGGCVLRPVSAKGLNPNENTIAKTLKQQGYNTACIGKWHLGDQPEFLPTNHVFDYYYGIPYSEDMIHERNPAWPPLPLMRNENVIEAPVDLKTITVRYTQEAVDFIKRNADNPFFLYIPHATPGSEKIPQVSKEFYGKSSNGRYGDSVEELDWSTGQILSTLRKLNLDDKTLVVFTSDNGAVQGHGGSNEPFRGWGYDTLEGGMRMPCIIRWPGKIPSREVSDELCMAMDFLPTFAGLSGANLPRDTIIDGKDIWPIIACENKAVSPHEVFYYYQRDQLQAVRYGKWKLHLPMEARYNHGGRNTGSSPLMLFDLYADIKESTDVSRNNPDLVKKILEIAEKARYELGDLGNPGSQQRKAGFVSNPAPRTLNKE
ncbi:sulfatase-like hydrolase/transferase [Candidatus Poribacteria bacterium]|nr:sulfatase-like hydrolase/transferase [Candidatus Poribacteria bacterium]